MLARTFDRLGLAENTIIVFTGDLTHTTDDATERRARMKRFREIVSALAVKDVRFMPGEHDASLDPTTWTGHTGCVCGVAWRRQSSC